MDDFLTLENQLCFAVYEAGSQFNKLYSKALESFGITYPQYLVLLALWEENGQSAKELGEKLNLGTGTLTPMIKRMEASGWVKRERSTADERKVCISLQPKALEEKEAIVQKIATELKLCNIEYEEYKQLMKQLRVLRGKLNIYNKEKVK
ncbi:MarR family winged helix-turn-helix transcriptional regulator [Mesobacillus selenatarsenatis]|uniref:HTH-type transcriptional regulator SarZ n=1 Tax=Mesobacillus selenatarsenatis (strain DSM 18680 / JCM 14380 / FERM P-15431 / SF-1) TaxID=1321606 RepID=A0A0A8WYW6_MESS1|nr:MarR family transcriptional regulator [Mesobacillus selenatarsenatis]GAM12189.1 organic hydroperoxide resistance transcriptional regulator [Mesobacillus selenatarsenatis SF-1]